jgi:hypothetical protein
MKRTDKSPTGTSFHGTTIKATVNELYEILGEPDCVCNDGQDKSNYDWTGETLFEDVFTVYDWKEYRPISSDEIITWHIGGKSLMVTETARQEIINAKADLAKKEKI